MTDRDELIERIVSRSLQVIQALKERQSGAWPDVDLTIQQLRALSLLYPVEGMPMRRLAESLGTSVTAITGLVDRLVDQGLVRRDHDLDDRRLVIARLTDAGRAKVERLQDIRRERLGMVLRGLTTEDLGVVFHAIDLLHGSVVMDIEPERSAAQSDDGSPLTRGRRMHVT